MSVFTRLGDYANGTIIDRDEWVNEFTNIYETFNGESDDKEIHMRFNGANPALIIDQLGAGLIGDFRQGGVSKLPIANNGKIANNNVVKKVQTWFIRFAAPSIREDDFKTFIVPNVPNFRVVRLAATIGSGSTTSGFTVFQLFKVGHAFSLTANLQIPPGATVGEIYEVGILGGSPAIVAGDILYVESLGFGSGSADNYTVVLEWEQGLG